MTQEVQFDFNNIVFFGRCLNEYVDMFDLDLASLKGKTVLDCPSGPASFALEAASIGISVTACDPLYVRDVMTLRELVDDHSAIVYEKQKAARNLFHPELVTVPERRKAMEKFLQDYVHGKLIGRYVPGVIPNLPFTSNQFDTTLSANFLFLYSDIESGGMLENSTFDYPFHKKALNELLRVTKHDLRIYPLQGPKNSEPHKYLAQSMSDLSDEGFKCEILPVKQRDIIGAETMLKVSKA
ncbi:MAG TPA: hypothetical protein V6C76_08130 [Drouetiella sp.]